MNVFLKIQCKTEHLSLIKKVIAPFDKKVLVHRKKRTDNPREESATEELFEQFITDDSKRTLSLRTIKNPITEKSEKDPITEEPKENTITEGPKEDPTTEDPQEF